MTHTTIGRTLAFAIVATLCTLTVGLAQAAKDSMNVAFPTKFHTMEPYQTSDRTNIQFGYLVFDPLVLRDPENGAIIPHLATAWKRVDDLTWEFKLRDGVKFHNGNALNAAAVEYTIEKRILNAEPKSPRLSNFKWVKDVEVIDDQTFRIHSEAPYPLALEQLNTLFVMDPAWTEEKGFDHVQGHAMGSGPYKFVSWDKGSKVTLTRNDDYWMEGVPAIKDITIKIVPEGSTRLAELFSGGVDLALNLLNDQLPSFKDHPEYEVLDFSILRIDFWMFDSLGRASDSPVKDVRVRQAIVHAIDKKKIVENLVQKEGYEVNAAVSPFAFGHAESIPGYSFDPALSKKLLAEAGFPNGFEIDLWQYGDHQVLFNQAAMQMLSKVGIKLNLKDYRGNVQQMGKLRRAGKITGIGNFNWGSYNIFDADAILHIFFDMDASNNYAGDKELSDWVNEARSSSDQELRKALYLKAQQRIHDQVYWMPTFGVRRFYGKHVDLDLKAGVDEVPRMQFARWKK